MKLLFKQRFFSWLDSYDIYDEAGNPVYTVKGRLSWGHCLEIFDARGEYLGAVKEEILTFRPRFAIYLGDEYAGQIKKELSFLHPSYTLDLNGWQVEGDFLGWDYRVVAPSGAEVMSASKQLFHWTDTYIIDVLRPEDALYALMIVLAIDAANCSGK